MKGEEKLKEEKDHSGIGRLGMSYIFEKTREVTNLIAASDTLLRGLVAVAERLPSLRLPILF